MESLWTMKFSTIMIVTAIHDYSFHLWSHGKEARLLSKLCFRLAEIMAIYSLILYKWKHTIQKPPEWMTSRSSLFSLSELLLPIASLVSNGMSMKIKDTKIVFFTHTCPHRKISIGSLPVFHIGTA